VDLDEETQLSFATWAGGFNRMWRCLDVLWTNEVYWRLSPNTFTLKP